MLTLSIILRAWILLMLENGACPRILADDVLVTAHSPKGGDEGTLAHPTTFARSLHLTLQYFADIGAKI